MASNISFTKSKAHEQINALIRTLNDFAASLPRAAQEEAGERIIEKVIERTFPFVPRDTGALEESAKGEVEKTKTGATIRVSYGGSTPVVGKNSPSGKVDYAFTVHENLNGVVFNTNEKPLAMEKFLEAGVIEALPEVRGIVVDAVREEVRSRVRK